MTQRRRFVKFTTGSSRHPHARVWAGTPSIPAGFRGLDNASSSSKWETVATFAPMKMQLSRCLLCLFVSCHAPSHSVYRRYGRIFVASRSFFPDIFHLMGGSVAECMVSVLDSGTAGPGFKSQPRRCRVTVLGKLFTPIVPLFTKQQNW